VVGHGTGSCTGNLNNNKLDFSFCTWKQRAKGEEKKKGLDRGEAVALIGGAIAFRAVASWGISKLLSRGDIRQAQVTQREDSEHYDLSTIEGVDRYLDSR
jgi:hypothetical protein